jgi:U4/U6.U5 tri-snRNP-associated protein 2
MKKFDGKSFIEEPVTCIRKKYRLYSLPKYLILHMKRFTKNEFFIEKNSTIVNFPIKNLDLSDFVWEDTSKPNCQP